MGAKAGRDNPKVRKLLPELPEHLTKGLKMCFSSPKPPSVSTPPAQSPPPTILPVNVSEVSAQETARKQRIAQLRYGFASTIKNTGGASGITGTGPNVQPSGNSNQPSKTLG